MKLPARQKVEKAERGERVERARSEHEEAIAARPPKRQKALTPEGIRARQADAVRGAWLAKPAEHWTWNRSPATTTSKLEAARNQGPDYNAEFEAIFKAAEGNGPERKGTDAHFSDSRMHAYALLRWVNTGQENYLRMVHRFIRNGTPCAEDWSPNVAPLFLLGSWWSPDRGQKNLELLGRYLDKGYIDLAVPTQVESGVASSARFFDSIGQGGSEKTDRYGRFADYGLLRLALQLRNGAAAALLLSRDALEREPETTFAVLGAHDSFFDSKGSVVRPATDETTVTTPFAERLRLVMRCVAKEMEVAAEQFAPVTEQLMRMQIALVRAAPAVASASATETPAAPRRRRPSL